MNGDIQKLELKISELENKVKTLTTVHSVMDTKKMFKEDDTIIIVVCGGKIPPIVVQHECNIIPAEFKV